MSNRYCVRVIGDETWRMKGFTYIVHTGGESKMICACKTIENAHKIANALNTINRRHDDEQTRRGEL